MVQSSDVAALSAFLFCVPLETSRTHCQDVLELHSKPICNNKCIKQIREVWVVPLKSDNEYAGMVIEVLFAFPTHFKNAVACFFSVSKKTQNNLPHHFKLTGDP